jgi:hypothetical protein
MILLVAMPPRRSFTFTRAGSTLTSSSRSTHRSFALALCPKRTHNGNNPDRGEYRDSDKRPTSPICGDGTLLGKSLLGFGLAHAIGTGQYRSIKTELLSPRSDTIMVASMSGSTVALSITSSGIRDGAIIGIVRAT